MSAALDIIVERPSKSDVDFNLCIHHPEYVCPATCQKRDLGYCAMARSLAKDE